MTTDIPTYCRICEPACGLVATIENGRLVSARADQDHPVSKGFACHKGIATVAMHQDPDRLATPRLRTETGWIDADWDQALGDIANRLQPLLEKHGPQSVGFYGGNPLGFNALGYMGVRAFFGQLPGHRFFSAGTQDCANKFVASEAMYGSRVVHPIPDLANTEFVLVLGANPRVSQGSFLSIPNMTQRLREAANRGATIHYVNPRRIETADTGGGDTLQIKPDTDVYFLAALANAARAAGGFDDAFIRRYIDDLGPFNAFIDEYPPAAVAEVTGIPAATIEHVATQLAEADGACIYMSTGVNMGRQGTVAYWLANLLTAVTGNLDRPGGMIQSVGYYPNAAGGRPYPSDEFVDSEFGPIRRGGLPGNLLSHYITDVDEPIRALFVVGGNPLLSIGGEARLREAFSQLELLVVVDIYPSATAEYATHMLAATDMYEREDVSVVMLGLQATPHVQYSPRLVEPPEGRKEEWWIFARLCQLMGMPSVLDDPANEVAPASLWSKYDYMLSKSNLSLEQLKAAPHGLEAGRFEPGHFFADIIQTDDAKIHAFPPGFDAAIGRAHAIFGELASEPADQMKLITRRDRRMHNSFFHNIESMHRSGRDQTLAHINPSDAATRDIVDGDGVIVSNGRAQLRFTAAIDDEIRPGVIAVPHGWGHGGAPGMRHAAQVGGVNVNALLPVGPDSYEPLSSQSHMTGIPVEVSRSAD